MIKEKIAGISPYTQLIILGLALSGLTLSSQYSYLLFHSVAELFSIVVAFSIFIIGWAARRSMKNDYLLFLGIAFLFIASLDTLHTLAFKGMGVFQEYDTNLPTQLWIATRYLQSLALLAAPFFLKRKLNHWIILGGFFLVTVLLVVTIVNRIFPACYIEGVGLTPFKIISEYLISVFLLISMVFLLRSRESFDPDVLRWLVAFIVTSILSEIAFTNYVSVFGPANLLGHLFKIVAFYCLFQAIVQTGFYRPFNLLLRDLKQNEEQLNLAQAVLEKRVEERTQQLSLANARLQSEMAKRQRTAQALQESEARLRTIFEESPLGIELVGLDGGIQGSNHVLRELLGYTEEELNRMSFRDFTEPSDFTASEIQFNRLAAGEQSHYQLEKRYVNRDGEPFWAHLSMSLVRDQAGKPRFAIGTIENISERKRVEAELSEVQRRLMDSREDERLSLARELHDGPIQDLLGIAMKVQVLGMDCSDEGEREDLASVREMVTQVSRTLRSICGELRPEALAPFGLEKAIRSHAEHIQNEHPEIEFCLNLAADQRLLPEYTCLSLYRIYQQSVINALKHARASQVTVHTIMDHEKFFLEVQDNGQGFVVPNGWIQFVREGHLGLAGMTERAEAIGGKLEVVSQPGQGTCIQIVVPWRVVNSGNGRSIRSHSV